MDDDSTWLERLPKFIKGPLLGLSVLFFMALATVALTLLTGLVEEIFSFHGISDVMMAASSNKELMTFLGINAFIFCINIGLNDYHGQESIGWPGLIFNHLSTGLSIALGVYAIIYTNNLMYAFIFGTYLIIWPYSYYYLGLGSRAGPFVESCVIPGIFFIVSNLLLIGLSFINTLIPFIISIICACLGIFLVIRMTLKNGSIIDTY